MREHPESPAYVSIGFASGVKMARDWTIRRKPNLGLGILRDYTPSIQLVSDAVELSPDWVVGFVDGEGCFHVSLNRHEEMTAGYQVLPEFVVVQHERDLQVLHALKRFFGAGVVRKNHGDRFCLRIRKVDALTKVCEFFQAHPLKTKKKAGSGVFFQSGGISVLYSAGFTSCCPPYPDCS